MNQIEFISVCNDVVPFFDGKYENLTSFMKSIELLNNLVTSEFEELFVLFLKPKIAGVTEIADCKTVDEILRILKLNITAEHSRIIYARLILIQIKNNDLLDFEYKVRKTSNHLVNASIAVGCSRITANGIATEKAIEVARANYKLSFIKIILTSCTFETPSEVITKFLIGFFIGAH